jgi:hypothetical protein
MYACVLTDTRAQARNDLGHLPLHVAGSAAVVDSLLRDVPASSAANGGIASVRCVMMVMIMMMCMST